MLLLIATQFPLLNSDHISGYVLSSCDISTRYMGIILAYLNLSSAKRHLTNSAKAERCNAQLAVSASLIYKHITPTICIYCLIALCIVFTLGFDSNSFSSTENSNSNEVRRQYLRCNYTKCQLEISIVFIYVLYFARVPICLPILL